MTTRELLCNHSRENIENWCQARARTAYLGKSVLCRVLGKLNLYVDPANYDMAPWLMLDGYWESWVAMAIGRAIQPGWTCVDAGAWCGYFSVMMADLVGPTGKVIAFEPNPIHHELASLGALANGQNWVQNHNSALTNEVGIVKFLQTNGGGSRIDDSGKVDVPGVSLDSLVAKIDLIKMDIEGAEEKAWAGMQLTLKLNPNIIVVMEWEPARYEDAGKFADSVCEFAGPREITTDGSTRPITKDDLLKPEMRMVWLQK